MCCSASVRCWETLSGELTWLFLPPSSRLFSFVTLGVETKSWEAARTPLLVASSFIFSCLTSPHLTADRCTAAGRAMQVWINLTTAGTNYDETAGGKVVCEHKEEGKRWDFGGVITDHLEWCLHYATELKLEDEGRREHIKVLKLLSLRYKLRSCALEQPSVVQN